MPNINLIAFPGNDLKEFLEKFTGSGKKYPIAESLLFTKDREGNPSTPDDKSSGGWEIKEDINIKAGTKVHIEAWSGQTQEKGTTILSLKIRPFREAWNDKVKREAAKAEKKDGADSVNWD
mgnify:CR=1 FL=1|tara:strand:- start:1397 stop:1759 length:363 start_codon:yes stop_codon:yes gene_type:complete